MQQRTTVATEQSTISDAGESKSRALPAPVELTEEQLHLVTGGLGPAGGWTADSVVSGPAGGW